MFLEGHNVGEHLAWMRVPRQAVDYRDGGMARQLADRGWIEHADHDCIDIARQNPGGIGPRFAAAELHLFGGQKHGVAAKLAHGDLERDAGAGRGPFEDHRQCLAGEQALAAVAARFDRAGGFDHAAQIGSGDLYQVEEVTDDLHPAAPSLRGGAALDGSLLLPLSRAQARSSRATPSAISCSLMISGGSKRTTLSPAATVSILSARIALTSSPAGTTARKPTRRPSPRTSAINDG